MIVNLTEKQILTIKAHIGRMNLSKGDEIALEGKLDLALESKTAREARIKEHHDTLNQLSDACDP